MRYIVFDKVQHEMEYKLLYDALVTRDQGYGMADIRKLNKVLDKLETIGQAVDSAASAKGVSMYKMGNGGVVALEDAEWEFAKTVVNDTKWIGVFSRKASNLADMLDNATTEAP